MRSGELFAGVGGLGMAVGEVFDAEPEWFCEFDDAPSKVLEHRFPDVPNFGDVRTVDFRSLPHTHVRCGGFPCQDVSVSGARAGLRNGTRSGLWSEFARSIAEDRPEWVVIENVGGLLSAEAHSDVEPCPWCLGDDPGEPAMRALGAVLADLAALGFDAEWTSIRASDVGAPHGRLRVFILAWPAERTLADDDRAGRGGVRRSPGFVECDADGRDRAGEDAGQLTLLPTPAVVMNDGEAAESWLARRERVKATGVNGNGMGMPLPIAVQLLPTPTVRNATGGNAQRGGDRSEEKLLPGIAAELAEAGRLLPTPDAYGGSRGGAQNPEKRREGGHTVSLADVAEFDLLPPSKQAALLPTPAAGDADRGPSSMREGGIMLTDAVPLLPTPMVGSSSPAAHGQISGDFRARMDRVIDEVTMMPTPRASRGGSATETMYGLGATRDDEGDRQGNVTGVVSSWGPYAAAIARWEAVIGRPAPSPVRMDGKGGKARLNPALPEWMMGWPFGWVTDPEIGLSRAQQLKAAGNGVVPQQAAAALRELLSRPGVPAIRSAVAA